jgi:hypothetical protein
MHPDLRNTKWLSLDPPAILGVKRHSALASIAPQMPTSTGCQLVNFAEHAAADASPLSPIQDGHAPQLYLDRPRIGSHHRRVWDQQRQTTERSTTVECDVVECDEVLCGRKVISVKKSRFEGHAERSAQHFVSQVTHDVELLGAVR